MGLHCDPCELLLVGDEERRAPGGLCPRCHLKMDVTRPITDAERADLARLIRDGKTRVEGDEERN